MLSCNWLYVLLDPLGVLEIVMVGNFNQHRWGVDLQYLGQSVGRAGVDSLRIWINFFELLCNDICKTLAQNSVLAAAGTIVNIAALQKSCHFLGRRIGVDGNMHAIMGQIGLSDGVNNGFLRIVADKLNAACKKVRFHCVGNEIHPVLFIFVIYIKVSVEWMGLNRFLQGETPRFISFPSII